MTVATLVGSCLFWPKRTWRDVRLEWVNSGRHLLAASFSGLDPSETLVRAQRNACDAELSLVQQAWFEGLLVPDDFWLRDRIIVAPASGDFADLIGEQIGTGRVRGQRHF